MNGQGVLVSGSYFPVLGVKPAIGRLLSPEDDQKVGESLVVVLSHAYWTTRFDRNPGVLNDTLIVNGQHLTIVGRRAGGLRRHHARRQAAGVRADHPPRHDESRLQPVPQPPELLGLSVRAAAAGRHARGGAHAS